MTRRYVAVGGTHAWRGDVETTGRWWQPESRWWHYMKSQGWLPAREDPFTWSTDLDGLWVPWKGQPSKTDWEAGGHALMYYLQGIPYQDRHVIAHSHGGQVVAFCVSHGVPIRSLVTVSVPVREDMRVRWELARPLIGRWVHLYSQGWADRWQWLGTLCDGHFGIVRRFDVAHYNIGFPRAGHSRLLTDPNWFSQWREAGVLDWIGDAPLLPE